MKDGKNIDRNFDGMSDRFARNIISSPKGVIRHQVLYKHLVQSLPSLQSNTPLQILDAGCGMGQMAASLLSLGHHVVLTDVSEDMLRLARELIKQQLKQPLDALNVSFQKIALQEIQGQTFDLVLCHAVLEWLADPKQAITCLAGLVKVDGYLSITFYNRDALIYRNLIRGNLRKVKSGDYAGHPGGFTPDNPLHPPQVFLWLEQQGFEIKATAGLRVFYDYLSRASRDQLSIEDIIELELEYSQRQPFLSLARYIHVFALRTES